MTTAVRLLATFIGYMTIFLWLLGSFGFGDFIFVFKVR